ncbi:uncharacterized protein LOC143853210 [Tasmannia lanceolata]|uniref:uncharacterized protein LOC143853210 n=1 Tax=Tasmannia lanceolata TaxID=3420 RepID=UPI004063B428
MRPSFLQLVFVVLFGVLGVCHGGHLKKNFYKHSCPDAEETVRNITWSHVASNPVLPAKLLRMHFHDCFVRGCDASILLNSTANNTAEKEAIPNLTIAGFDFIDEVKSQLEDLCPDTVSCADIIALSARDAVSFQFNRSIWKVLTGRRDGNISRASEALANIPAPFFNFSTLNSSFASKGLSIKDLVVLSGAHTIGVGHCNLFSNRLYNFTGKGDADPSLNSTYADFLRTKCPSLSDTNDTVPMDPKTPLSFDNNYYPNLNLHQGLFTSDAALLTNDESGDIVDDLLDSEDFFEAFRKSIKKMAAIQVLTGDSGEIRKQCGVINSVADFSLIQYEVNQLNPMQPNLPQQEPSDHCNAVFALRSDREYQREEGRSEPSKDAQESPIKVSKESSSIGSEEEPEQMVAKYKDPGCPTIACTIGNTHINHALLDLGASVNLLPLSVFKQLGLGELKPTTVTLQLADRSMKKPKGMVEDVLVKVGEFLFPVDFIVLETEPVANIKDQIPIILGRPFLATSNALIDCRNGLMKLTFGNASMDFNVFRLGFEEALDEEGLENARDIGDSFSDDLSIQQIEFGASLSPPLPKPPPKKAPHLLKMRLSFLQLAFVVVFVVLGVCHGSGLKKNFYKHSCPDAEKIVKKLTWSRVAVNVTFPAKLLRMHFHDCFVRGCDASILLNSTPNKPAEKEALPNLSVEGFDFIDEVKSKLEEKCPGVVSCADIIALAARDAVSFQFKRFLWEVPTGRRDGHISRKAEALANIPSPFFNFTSLKHSFARKGLDVKDLVVLAGAHSIGVGLCNFFSNRLYNFTGKGDMDPSLNATYAAFLKTKCRSLSDNTTTVFMDPKTPFSFGNHYYPNLKIHQGLFQSDAALLTNRESNKLVDDLLVSSVFFHDFKISIKKMGMVRVRTGESGEIRKKCTVVNS